MFKESCGAIKILGGFRKMRDSIFPAGVISFSGNRELRPPPGI